MPIMRLRSVGARPLGELTALTQTPSWWGKGSLALPKNLTLLSAFGFDFRPFGARGPM